jgi:hypothetical protein
MTVGGYRHPAINNSRADFPLAFEGSVVGPSAAEKQQPSTLRGSDERHMRVRLKEVF